MRFLFVKSNESGIKERCWTGYTPVQGKPAYSKGSCKKTKKKSKRNK